jgi:hypothetical protein
MALRVTQQSVDVLSEATGGKLRVTQFYVEVLGTPGADLSVTSTLSLTGTATGSLETTHAASSTLSLTSTATEFVERSLSASSVLAFSQLADNATRVDAASVLALTDTVNQVFDRTVASVLALTDVAHESPIHLSVSTSIPLQSTAVSSIKTLSVSSAMVLTSLAKTDRLEASSVLAFTDAAETNISPHSVANAILLSDEASGSLFHMVASILSLDDDLDRMVIFKRALASDLDLVQSIEIFIDRAGELCNYSPSVGFGPFLIPATPPVLTPGTLTLFWPFVSPSLTLVLRNPEFGNKISFNANRINRKSRGGTLRVFRKLGWPKFHTLQMDISVLSTTQIEDFKTFLNTTLGLEIGLTDHEGRTWKGIITTPDTDITQISGTSCGNFATSFQFEGELA